jgi:hypothetical protein
MTARTRGSPNAQASTSGASGSSASTLWTSSTSSSTASRSDDSFSTGPLRAVASLVTLGWLCCAVSARLFRAYGALELFQ